MRFKLVTSITKHFPDYEISKGESLKNSGFDGIQFKPMTKYFLAFDQRGEPMKY